ALHRPGARLSLRDRRGPADELERCRRGVVRPPILREAPEADRRARLALALLEFELAGERAQQHRLAGAVLTDYADALAAEHRHVDACEDRHPTELDARVAQLDDAVAAARVRAKVECDPAALEHRPFDLLHAVDLTL